jgi:hypothetical protein
MIRLFLVIYPFCKQLKILFIESFFAGPHKNFVLRYQQHSSHEIELVTLPARFWKWRMRGTALYFFNAVKNLDEFDAVLAIDMMNIANFKSLCIIKPLPNLLYFHKN